MSLHTLHTPSSISIPHSSPGNETNQKEKRGKCVSINALSDFKAKNVSSLNCRKFWILCIFNIPTLLALLYGIVITGVSATNMAWSWRLKGCYSFLYIKIPVTPKSLSKNWITLIFNSWGACKTLLLKFLISLLLLHCMADGHNKMQLPSPRGKASI